MLLQYRGFRSPKCASSAYGRSCIGEIKLHQEIKISPPNSASTLLLQHSIREHLVCINGRSTKKLTGLKPAWKKVEAVAHIAVRGYASKSILICNLSKGNLESLLVQLLNDFKIRLSNCRTQAFDVSDKIIIDFPSPLKNFILF